MDKERVICFCEVENVLFDEMIVMNIPDTKKTLLTTPHLEIQNCRKYLVHP